MMYDFFGIHISLCDGIYNPSDDTFMIIENVKCTGKSIEIGCGTGLVSLYFKRNGCNIECTDINMKAVECTLKNGEANGLKINAYRSDLFENVEGIYDTIIFNPPYLPAENEDPAWDGGKTGLEVSERFIVQAYPFLNKGGHIYMILSDLTDVNGFISRHGEYVFREIARNTFDFEAIILYSIEKR